MLALGTCIPVRQPRLRSHGLGFASFRAFSARHAASKLRIWSGFSEAIPEVAIGATYVLPWAADSPRFANPVHAPSGSCCSSGHRTSSDLPLRAAKRDQNRFLWVLVRRLCTACTRGIREYRFPGRVVVLPPPPPGVRH